MLTIRGFDEELQRRVQLLARKEGISLNKAALLLLRRGAGLETPPHKAEVIGDSLRDLIGTWSAEEEEEFLEAIQMFEQVDESF